jgi:hypothetical protein
MKAFGAFLPNPEAESYLLEALNPLMSEYTLGGEQSAAIIALIQHYPALLLARFIELYDLGELNDGARLAVAYRISRIEPTSDQAVSPQMLVDVLQRLISDPDYSVREVACQALTDLDPAVASNVYDALTMSDQDEKRAYATYSLGFWDSDIEEITKAQRDHRRRVRRAADEAMRIRSKWEKLRYHVSKFASDNPLERLAAAMCIINQGDERTIRLLMQSISENQLASVYLGHLEQDIRERLKHTRRETIKEEKKANSYSDSAWFSRARRRT